MRILLLGSLILALAGCGGSPVVASPDPPGREKAFFPDLPMPDGFTYERGYGHQSSAGHIRVYTQILTGRRRAADVEKFYRDVLPVHGWTFVSALKRDPPTLVFEKKAERCAIEIKPDGAGLRITLNLNAK